MRSGRTFRSSAVQQLLCGDTPRHTPRLFFGSRELIPQPTFMLLAAAVVGSKYHRTG